MHPFESVSSIPSVSEGGETILAMTLYPGVVLAGIVTGMVSVIVPLVIVRVSLEQPAVIVWDVAEI